MTETTATTGTSAGKDGKGTAEDSALTETPAEARGEARVEDSGNAPPADAVVEDSVDESAEEHQEPRSEREPGEAVGWSARLSRATYTRAPGMTPPPEEPEQLDDGGSGSREPTVGVPPSAALSATAMADAASTGSFPLVSSNSGSFPLLGSSTGSFPTVSAAAPVSAPPRQGTTGRVPTPGGVTVRPIGPGATGPAVGSARVEVRPRAAATPRGPRRARLNVKRIDPWSVMKFSFAVSLVLFVVVIVAASVLYLALDAMGVFTSINSTVAELVDAGGGESTDTFRISAQGVIGTAAVLGALNVLLFTSLATLGAFIYNVCADLVGGVEVTLAERD